MKYRFRGASKSNPTEWLYGNLVADCLIYQKQDANMLIDPLSIGLCSAATDANGVQIFENDILKDLYNNYYYKVTFDGLDFWLEVIGADMPYMLLKDANLSTLKVIGNSYEVK